MSDSNIETGDQVSWKWGSGAPAGEVVDVVKEGELAIQSDKGNTIKRNAEPDDPAIHIARPGNDVVKRAHEVSIQEKASVAAANVADHKPENATSGYTNDDSGNGASEPMAGGDKPVEERPTAPMKTGEPTSPLQDQTGEPPQAASAAAQDGDKSDQPPEPIAAVKPMHPAETVVPEPAADDDTTMSGGLPSEPAAANPEAAEPSETAPEPGEKRDLDVVNGGAESSNAQAEAARGEPEPKKQKTETDATNGEAPKNANGTSAPKKEKPKKKAATETGEPRRSGRLAKS